jgi:hypothetical protein
VLAESTRRVSTLLQYASALLLIHDPRFSILFMAVSNTCPPPGFDACLQLTELLRQALTSVAPNHGDVEIIL